MSTYLFRRLLFLLLTVLITSLIVFAVTQWLPGDVCRIILGREAGEGALESCRQDLGLDEPLPVQYVRWLAGFLSGDWGVSYSTKAPVFEVVMQRTRNSLMLAFVTLVIAIFLLRQAGQGLEFLDAGVCDPGDRHPAGAGLGRHRRSEEGQASR